MAVFNHTKHKELWNWLADNPGSSKADWPGWFEHNARNRCFACEAIDYVHYSCREACPLQWGSEDNKCCSPGSPYFTWTQLMKKLNDSRARLDIELEKDKLDEYKDALRLVALAIANLPLRPDTNVEVI